MRRMLLALALLPACKSLQSPPASPSTEPQVVAPATPDEEEARVAMEAEAPATKAADVRSILIGRLLLGGEPAHGWEATLSMRSGFHSIAVLDAQGRFRIEAPAPGRARLHVWKADRQGAVISSKSDWVLAPGEQTWEQDLDLGRIEGRIGSSASRYAWIQASWSAGEVVFVSVLEPDSEGRYVLEGVPVGAVELRGMDCFVDRKLATVQVERGETVRRDLP